MKHRILYLLSALCILLTGCSALPVNTGDEIAYWTGETPFNAAVIPAAPTCTDGVFYADGQALPYPFLILTAEPPSCGGSPCHAFSLYSACSMAASRSPYSSKAGY